MKAVCHILAILVCSCTLFAQQPTPSPNWDAWKFLIGKWVGEAISGREWGISRSNQD